jgi:hypothetical protein
MTFFFFSAAITNAFTDEIDEFAGRLAERKKIKDLKNYAPL